MSIQISLAPFQGITQKEYRNAYARCFPGLDAVFSPFISGVNPDKVNASKFNDVLPREINPIETIPQFVSTNSREIIAIANFLEDQGYNHINWNMGCPFSRLANKMRGCGILPYPDTIRKMLEEVIPAINIRLSVKARLGYRTFDELQAVIPVFNDFPIDQLIIHPRIGTQLYKGEVNLEGFAQSMKHSKTPVTYNGDIYHASRYKQLQTLFPEVKSWMIGRAALINPFLAAQMKGIDISLQQKRSSIHEFHELLLEHALRNISRPVRQLGFLKSVWYYMSGLFVDGPQFFNQMKVSQSTEAYLTALKPLLEQPFAQEDEMETYFRKGLKHI